MGLEKQGGSRERESPALDSAEHGAKGDVTEDFPLGDGGWELE